MSDFDRAFEIVIESEGGYADDQSDPGGETNFGISKRAYPKEDIRFLTLDRAKEIYKRDYWDAIRADELPYPINILIFDAAVNQGKKAAVRMLQEALKITVDGVIGKQTIKAVVAASDSVCADYLSIRAVRYAGTHQFQRFGRGWMKRLFVLAMETGK